MEANSPQGPRREEPSENGSPVVDTFFYLRGPGADLLVVVRLKYPAPLANLQKRGETVDIAHLCVEMQGKARVQGRGTLFSFCHIGASRFVVKSAPPKPSPREYCLQSAMATVVIWCRF